MASLDQDTKEMLTDMYKKISNHIDTRKKEFSNLKKEIVDTKTEEKKEKIRTQIKNNNN